jgi:2-methylisocitrate lyase-like PEP mutase family enzyme
MKQIRGPHMATLSHAAGKAKVTLKELDDCGVCAVSFPSAALFAAVGGVTRAMQALKKDGNFEAVDDELVPLDDYYDLVGLKFYNDYERECVEEGLRIAGKKAAAAE